MSSLPRTYSSGGEESGKRQKWTGEKNASGNIPFRTSLVAQTVKRLSTMRETWVRSLGQEDSLEKAMATHSSTLVWKIPWTAELGAGHCPCGRKELSTTE